MDSAVTAENQKGNKFGPSMAFFQQNGTKYFQTIFKDDVNLIVSDYVLRFVSTKNVVTYKESKNQFDWKISTDTLSIGGIICQKAETFFGNRKWEAWFAPSIPISEGPYKFNGLPGLIIRVHDQKQHWNFDLASIHNINKNLQINKYKKTLPIKDKETFFERRKYYTENRFLLMKQNGWTFSDEVSSRKEYEEYAIKDNNWIELYRPKR
jgi:GLPGLI family protein